MEPRSASRFPSSSRTGTRTSGELVIVVEDDDAVRASLEALLETAGYRTAPFESGIAFLDSSNPEAGACVVLDVKMPGMDGLEVQRRLNERMVVLPVIIVTGRGDVAMAVQAMRAGAIDFIEKPVGRDRLLESVAQAVALSDDIRCKRAGRAEIVARIDTLTARERQVFDRLIIGRSNKVVAHELGISPRTIEIYRRNVMRKMAARSLSHRRGQLGGVRERRPGRLKRGVEARTPRHEASQS